MSEPMTDKELKDAETWALSVAGTMPGVSRDFLRLLAEVRRGRKIRVATVNLVNTVRHMEIITYAVMRELEAYDAACAEGG